MADIGEDIVMTPTKKGEATHIKIERKRRLTFEGSDVAHVAGGQHKGLVINKQTSDDENDLGKPQLQLSFTCFLIDQKTSDHIVENRKLKFWYVEGTEYLDQVTRAYDFFKELIKPDDLPRDYVGFIKKCMKQMQGSQYKQIKKVDLTMQQLNKDDAPLSPEIIEPRINVEENLEATINVEEAASKDEQEKVTPDVIIERQEEITPSVTVVEEATIASVKIEREEPIAPVVIVAKEETIKTVANVEREELIAPVVIVEREEPIAPVVIVEREELIAPVVIVEREEPIAPVVIVAKEETIKTVANIEREEAIVPVVIVAKEETINTVVNVEREELIAPVVIVAKEETVKTVVNIEREELIAPVVIVAKEETIKTVANIEREEPIAPVVIVAKEETVKTVINVEREEPIAPVVIVAKEETIKTVVNVEREKPIAPVVIVERQEPIAPVVIVAKEETIKTVNIEREALIAPYVVVEREEPIAPVVIVEKEDAIKTVGKVEREELMAQDFVVVEEQKVATVKIEKEERIAPVVFVEKEKSVQTVNYYEQKKEPEVTPVITLERGQMIAPVVVMEKEKNVTTVEKKKMEITPVVIEKQETIAPVVIVDKQQTVTTVDFMEDKREEMIAPVLIQEDHREKMIAPVVIHERKKTIDRFEEPRKEMVAPVVIREKEETINIVDNVVEEEKVTSTYLEREEKITPVAVVEEEEKIESFENLEEIEMPPLDQLEDDELLPVDEFEEIVLPPLDHFGLTADGLPKVDNRPPEEIVNEKLLHILESAYPNILAVEDLIRITAADEVIVREQLQELYARNLVSEMEQGGFMRHVLDEKSEVQLVKQMPTIATNQQPTIAIITAMYYEKLAVDAMMENKTTYMKYKTEGESNVYTIGFIGEHKVVSTKLPAIGHAMFAQISSGNTTTRLLGTFQNIEHVFIVGVAGGVPYYTDFYKHVRLGDIVISKGGLNNNIYYYCQKILKNKDGDLQYVHKTFAPKDPGLQQVAQQIAETAQLSPDCVPWEQYIEEGQTHLQGQEANFVRPLTSTDRLYMNIGEDNIIEVEHPQPPEISGDVKIRMDKPRIHFGVLGSGRPVVKTDATRLDFASKYNIKAFDTEFDQVLESIEGNRKDSFMFIRGVSDYTDGSKNKEWQPYAALAAAAYMKTIIKALSNPLVDDM